MLKTIRYIDEREIHQIGDFVSVCFNTTERKVIEGNRMIIDKVRDGRPYIDFPFIKVNGVTGNYVADDLTVEGGLTKNDAAKVVSELQEAIKYMESL